jgi:RHS repeat-associated protein
MFLDVLDFALAAPMPLRFLRSYNSRTSNIASDLGYGWTHNFGWQLRTRRRRWVIVDDRGREEEFEVPAADGTPTRNGLGWLLRVGSGGQAELRIPKRELVMIFAGEETNGIRWLKATRDRNGNEVRIQRGSSGALSGFIDSAGRPYRVDTNSQGLVISISVAADAAHSSWITLVRYSHDDAGNLVSVTDAEGYENRFQYFGHLVTEHRLACGLSFCYRYDVGGHEARCVESWGEYIGKQDPALEHPLPVRPTTPKDRRRVKGIRYVRLTYDPQSRYTEVENGLGGVTRYFGDEAGRVIKRVSPMGGVVERAFDPTTGSLIAESGRSGALLRNRIDDEGVVIGFTDSTGEGVRMIRDSEGSIITIDERNGQTSIRRYDGRGNLIYHEHADGTRETYEYDERGRMTASVDRRGASDRFVYDEMGNMVLGRPHGGGQIVATYDYLGRRLSHIDARGRKTEWRWNLRNEVVWKRHADGSQWVLEWDANGKLARIDASGQVWRYQYGGLGWVTEILGPRGDVTSFRYDVEGNLTYVRNARGQVYHQSFDLESRPIGAVTFEGVKLEGRLDPMGKMVASFTPTGVANSVYDEQGHLIELEFGDGETVKIDHLIGAGTTRIDNGEVLLESWFDSVGQVVRETQGDHENRIQWVGGRVAAIASDRGPAIEITRDPMTSGAMIKVGSTELGVRQHEGIDFLTTLGDSLVLRRRRGPTGLLEKQFLARRRPGIAAHEVATEDDPNLIFRAEYEFDAAQLLRRERRSGDVVLEYDVDAGGQITEKRTWERGVLKHTEKIAYDLAGTPRVAGAIFDSLARPVGLGDEVFAYDAEGALASRTTADGVWRYAWSHSGSLIRVEAPTHVVEMDYDGRGRRMRKRVFRTRELVSSTSYIWSNEMVLREIDDLSGATRTYLRDNESWEAFGHVDSTLTQETPVLYVLDPVGALDFAVDVDGRVVFSASRSVFGHYASIVSTQEVSLRFLNQHYDVDVGLVYNRFRWYDPRLGLFVSRDPIELDGTLNPRDYAPNPRRFIDPMGLAIATPTNPAQDPHGHPPRPAMPDAANPMNEDQTNHYLTAPGYNATNGTDAVPGYVVADSTERNSGNFRASTRATINTAGDTYGCHSCGRSRQEVTADDGKFGCWRKDHQPPQSHIEAADRVRARQGLPEGTVRIYPHCPRCSNTQGGLAQSRPPTPAQQDRAAAMMNSRTADATRMGPPRR